MLIGNRTPARYEITITPVTPTRRPLWLWALITLLLLAVAAVIDQPDQGNATPPPQPTHTQSADDHDRGQD
ncbi:hypothetical protein AB0C93_31630 [Streptomyces sp. NPDC048518]|uniref:hypothetical protein n=1 Tax=Streptomyces sp. NPDC048518 TaxID=3155029 RepID=UPI0033F9E082